MKLLDLGGARRWCALGLLGIILAAGSPLRGADSPTDADEELLKEAASGVDAASLLKFLRDRSLDEADLGQIPKLIRRLGSDNFDEREQAARGLVLFGSVARARLQRAAEDPDPEIARRAKACLARIAVGVSQEVPAAAVRLLLQRRPAGAVETLLRYLPFVQEESLEVEIAYGVESLAVTAGKVHPALLAALQDKAPARRALAACIVGHHGDGDARAGVRKLLDDPEPMVRLRAAQGLLAARDKAALPVLIALLDEPAAETGWQAEELLHWAADDSAPDAVVGAATAAERRRCREAWEVWQRKHGANIDLTKIDARLRRVGLLLLCKDHSLDPKDESPGRVWLRGCDGKPRWQFQGWITDAQLLPGNRVLLCEQTRDPDPGWLIEWAVERDLQGHRLWKTVQTGHLSHVRRLADGDTFVSDFRGDVHFVGPDGKRTPFNGLGELQYPRQQGLGTLIPDGESRVLGNSRLFWANGESGLLAEYDPIAKRHRRIVWFEDRADTAIQILEVLPNGHWLVSAGPSETVRLAALNEGKPVPDTAGVRELGINGKRVWRWRVSGVISAARLANGNTVVASTGFLGVNVHPGIVEVDAAGKKVWEDFSVGRVRRVRVCLPLVRLGFDQPAAAPLDLDAPAYRAKGLKDKDPEVRLRAAEFLNELGPKAEPFLPELVEALADSDWKVAGTAEGTLWQIGRAAVPPVLDVLQDKRPLVRAHALLVVGGWKVAGQFEPATKAALPKILAALRDEDALVRRCAVAALRGFGKESEAVLPALVAALKDKTVWHHPQDGRGTIAVDAAWYLDNFGSPAVPALLDAINDEDRRLSDTALDSLGRIAARDKSVVPVVLPVLIKILQDEKQFPKRLHAIGALPISPEVKQAVPALRDNLRFPALRNAVLWAFRDKVGPSAEPAVPDILAIAQDKEQEVPTRQEAVQALGAVGPAAKAAIPFLTEVVKVRREDARILTAAADALRKIQQ
jgi:HEAT repeat protein